MKAKAKIKTILSSIQHITNTIKSKWEQIDLTALVNLHAGKAQKKGQTSSQNKTGKKLLWIGKILYTF